ncbi:MAG: hypothetical protein ACKVQB_13755 [Bacteroidia bacterium]
MIIKDILNQLEGSVNPVAKAIHSGENFKVLGIGFKKGMVMKEHISKLPARLTVLSGNIIYIQGMSETSLLQYDNIDIPVNEKHSLLAMEDSLCVLTQG